MPIGKAPCQKKKELFLQQLSSNDTMCAGKELKRDERSVVKMIEVFTCLVSN